MIGMCYKMNRFTLVPITKLTPGQGETTLSQSEVDTHVRPLFEALLETQRSQSQWERFPLNFKTRVYSYIPGTNPVPSKLISDPEPYRPINKDFKRRSAAGEIVLSGFKNWQVQIDYTNGGQIKRYLPESLTEYYGGHEYYPFVGSGSRNGFLFIGDTGYKFRVDAVWDFVEYKAELTPYQLGWVDPTIQELDDFISTRVVKSSMVTETLADHNDRTVDMLTSMAEMPDTVRMIYDAVKNCLRLYIDVRSKNLRLQNKVAVWKMPRHLIALKGRPFATFMKLLKRLRPTGSRTAMALCQMCILLKMRWKPLMRQKHYSSEIGCVNIVQFTSSIAANGATPLSMYMSVSW